MNSATPSGGRWSSIEDLCDRHLGAHFSAANLATMRSLANERAEVRDFIERAFRLMAIARFEPKDMSPSLASALAVIIPGLLPGSWGGIIPPFTWEERHKVIDAYLRDNPWAKFEAGTVLLDVGCGFPPHTAVDAARAFPHWHIIGADPSFDPYVLYDSDGNYACLTADGEVRYFHPNFASTASLSNLYESQSSTFHRFRELFASLAPLLPAADDGHCATVERDGARLLRNPVRSYARPNLTLIQAGVGADLPKADIVRCFNVLFYFDAGFRKLTEEWALRTLRPGGLFLCGANSARTLETRYTVYKSDQGRLAPKEFAFSIDNVRPLTVLSWFCLHDGERETFTLAGLIGLLRRDEAFRSGFGARLDGLLAEARMWERDADGNLVAPSDQLSPARWSAVREEINARLDRDGYVDRAVTTLRRAGYNAWRNTVGHIGIDPAGLGP